MFDVVIRGATVVTEDWSQKLDLVLHGGKIGAVLAPGVPIQAQHEIDAQGKYLIPGVIDVHFHVRAPAHPHRGTVATETQAAAAGGITTIFEMPISNPCCATPAIVQQRREHFAKEAFVNFALYGAPGMLDPDLINGMIEEGVIGFKLFMTEAPPGREEEFKGLSLPDEGSQYEALRLVARSGLVTVVHAESNELIRHFSNMVRACSRGRNDPRHHGQSRPTVAEAVAIAKLLTMNLEIGAPLHIAHVSSAQALQVLRLYQQIGMNVSGETCPHYLLFTERILDQVGVFGKINPPIRLQRDQDDLWKAIGDGTLAMVATDHSPFSVEEKERHRNDILEAPPGVPGAEVLLLSMLDSVHAGRLTLSQVVALTSVNGAKRFGLYPQKGSIRPGADADLVLVDLNATTTISRKTLFTQGRLCDYLYDGLTFRAAIDTTILAGKVIYRQGRFLGRAGDGKFVSPKPTLRESEVRV